MILTNQKTKKYERVISREDFSSYMDQYLMVPYDSYDVRQSAKDIGRPKSFRTISYDSYCRDVFENLCKHDPELNNLSNFLKSAFAIAIRHAFLKENEMSLQHGGNGLQYPTFVDVMLELNASLNLQQYKPNDIENSVMKKYSFALDQYYLARENYEYFKNSNFNKINVKSIRPYETISDVDTRLKLKKTS